MSILDDEEILVTEAGSPFRLKESPLRLSEKLQESPGEKFESGQINKKAPKGQNVKVKQTRIKAKNEYNEDMELS